MAGTANARGGLGWVILVVALAVPGVLFYNWWSHLKAEREKTVAAKARGRVPDGGVFQSSPNAKLVNPMTPAVSTGTAAATAPASMDAAHAASAAAAAAPLNAQAATIAAPSVTVTALAAPAGGVQSPAFSSSTATAPPLKRDPTLSPFDQIRIIEEQEAKDKAARDLEDMKRAKKEGKKPKKARAVDPKSLVELQGIISNAESGFKAIVNNEVMGVGEFVGSTKVKIIRITDLGVTFDFQGTRFIKGVSRD